MTMKQELDYLYDSVTNSMLFLHMYLNGEDFTFEKYFGEKPTIENIQSLADEIVTKSREYRKLRKHYNDTRKNTDV